MQVRQYIVVYMYRIESSRTRFKTLTDVIVMFDSSSEYHEASPNTLSDPIRVNAMTKDRFMNSKLEIAVKPG